MTSNPTSRPRNPAFAGLETYPFVKLDQAKARARAQGITVLDFTIGDPHEETPALVRERLIASLPRRSAYPPAVGIPALRRAFTDWVGRRFGVELDPERHVVPANGSKEAVFSIHQALVDPRGTRRVVLLPEPAYPVYETGARFAGAEVVPVPLLAENAFLPDLRRLEPALLSRTALFWLNYPNNPTSAIAPASFYRDALALARQYGFWLCSDEAYSEIYFGDPPETALTAGLENLLVFQTLSKRSAMTGYRSGMIAGDPEAMEWLKRLRPSQGTATPTFVQEAATAAWNDEAHVAEQRAVYARKREILLPLLQRAGLEVRDGGATFFLWFRVPAGETSQGFADRVLAEGVAVAPGSMFGDTGEGWARLALVPTVEECQTAAGIMERVLARR